MKASVVVQICKLNTQFPNTDGDSGLEKHYLFLPIWIHYSIHVNTEINNYILLLGNSV